jgi:hypothetical protein
MRRCGDEERECYAWWSGYFIGDGNAQIVTALYPDIHTEFGHVHLGLPELTAMHEVLRELDQVLLVELHTHPPGAGGQNDVDATHPAATYPGFISIVVPDFASPYLHDLRATYVYEYEAENRWRTLGPGEIEARFVIEEPLREVKTSPS